MAYNLNGYTANQYLCPCTRQDRLFNNVQGSNNRINRTIQPCLCTSNQVYSDQMQLSCLCCQRIQLGLQCHYCENRRSMSMSQKNDNNYCYCCPYSYSLQTYCQCTTLNNQNNSMQSQVTDLSTSNNINSNINTNNTQIIPQQESNYKTAVNPETINIALSGQTPESLSISIDSRGVVTLGVNNPTNNNSNVNNTDENKNKIRNALTDRH